MAKGGEFILPSDVLPDIFTVDDFTDEQKLFEDMLGDFVTREVIPQSEKIESKDWDLTRILNLKLGELDALGTEVPEEFGGTNFGKVAAAIFAEKMGWQGSLACTELAGTGIALLPLVLFGSKEQKQRFIPGVVVGKAIGAYSLTEAGSGSDAKSISAKAVLTGDGRSYVLNGSKIWVTNGSLADYFIVFAKVDGDEKKITAFIVEKGFSGIHVGSEYHKLGILGSSTAPLTLTDVLVPLENVLGQVGAGWDIAMNVLNLGRFKLGAACLGGAEQCFQESLKYSQERKQFKVTIGSFGGIRQKLCRMSALIYGMESVVYRTAGLLDVAISAVDHADSKALMNAIREYAAECSLVKVFCSEVQYEIATENVRVHGGNGFMKEYPAERHLRDSVINPIFEGTNEVNRPLAVKEALGRMAGSLMQEGKKIREEILATPATDIPEGIVEILKSQLKGAKKAVIASGGGIYQKFGTKLIDWDNQEILVLLADCLMYLYVLDSALAVFEKHANEKREYLTRYLFNAFLPEIEKRVKGLAATGFEGDELRTMLAATRKLFKYSPENILELDRKIAENFS